MSHLAALSITSRGPVVRWLHPFLIALVLFPAILYGQILSEAGIPYLRNYPPEEFNAFFQNWQTVQDGRGVMYFANTDGVLEYDGVSWRLISIAVLGISNSSEVRSLAIGEAGRIYVGAYDELGFLQPDSSGQWKFVSLLQYLPKSDRKIGYVLKIVVTKDGVYFQNLKYIFRFAASATAIEGSPAWKVNVWKNQASWWDIFLVQDKLYVFQREVGMLQVIDDSLRLIPGGEKFAIFRTIRAILSYPESGRMVSNTDINSTDTGTLNAQARDSGVIIADYGRGLFLYNGNTFTKIQTDIEQQIHEKKINHAIILPNGDIAIAILNMGVFIVDRYGKLKLVLDKSSGLLEDSDASLYLDKQNGLWVTYTGGITRVEISSPLKTYDQRLGLKGRARQTAWFQDRFYVTTSQGLFYAQRQKLPEQERKNRTNYLHRFKQFPGLNDHCWGMFKIGNTLLIAMRDGAYAIQGGQATRVYDKHCFTFLRSKFDTNRVYIGSRSGLGSIYLTKHGVDGTRTEWINEGQIDGTEAVVRWLHEDDDGALWLGTYHRGAIRVTVPPNLNQGADALREALLTGNLHVEHFDTTHGLPEINWVRVYSISGRPVFTAANGIYRFDEQSYHFVPDSTLGKIIPNTLGDLDRMVEDDRGNVWIEYDKNYQFNVAVVSRKNGSYFLEKKPAIRLGRAIYNIIPDSNKIFWFAGVGGLFRYDAKIDTGGTLNFSALVRRVTVSGDSLIYGGTSPQLGQQELPRVLLPYVRNAMRLEYAAPSYDDESANRYQYILEGLDKNWSNWSDETQKDYTNLPEGDYRFRVRARNVYNHISSEGVFTFEILSPWYRAWWAFGFYALLFVGLLLGSMQWRGRKLIKEKEALEQIVAERTEEVKAQAEKLQEMDKLKSRFFANISHEFRTPLTLIIDPLNAMISDSFAGDLKRQYGVMKRNAGRLLRLINQLLDLSKLESGMMKVQAGFNNIVPFLKGVVYSFESTATVRNIDLNFKCDEDSIELYYDRDKLEQIVTNLLSNALKFTPEGGSVIVDCRLQIANLKDHQPEIRNCRDSRKRHRHRYSKRPPASYFRSICASRRFSDSRARRHWYRTGADQRAGGAASW